VCGVERPRECVLPLEGENRDDREKDEAANDGAGCGDGVRRWPERFIYDPVCIHVVALSSFRT